MPALMKPEIMGASFPVRDRDHPYQAMYLGRSCANHWVIKNYMPTVSCGRRTWGQSRNNNNKKKKKKKDKLTMSVTEISHSDSTGAPNSPSRIRLARYVVGVTHRGAVARITTLVASDSR